MQVAESELEKIMTLIKEVEQRKERAVPSFIRTRDYKNRVIIRRNSIK